MSFMDISIFPSWFYWPGEESRKSEYGGNCHVLQHAHVLGLPTSNGKHRAAPNTCGTPPYITCLSRAELGVYSFLFFLLTPLHFFGAQTWWFEGQLTALMMPPVASQGPLQQCLSQKDAQDESSSELEASCPTCLSPLCLFSHSPGMLGHGWEGHGSAAPLETASSTRQVHQ